MIRAAFWFRVRALMWWVRLTALHQISMSIDHSSFSQSHFGCVIFPCVFFRFIHIDDDWDNSKQSTQFTIPNEVVFNPLFNKFKCFVNLCGQVAEHYRALRWVSNVFVREQRSESVCVCMFERMREWENNEKPQQHFIKRQVTFQCFSSELNPAESCFHHEWCDTSKKSGNLNTFSIRKWLWSVER